MGGKGDGAKRLVLLFSCAVKEAHKVKGSGELLLVVLVATGTVGGEVGRAVAVTTDVVSITSSLCARHTTYRKYATGINTSNTLLKLLLG